jgi:DNA topoisomerase-1
LQAISGQRFTAKDFRIWAGTVLAAIALHRMEVVDSKSAAKKNIVTAVEAGSKLLGNTPPICRKCYIHPTLSIPIWTADWLAVCDLRPTGKSPKTWPN